MRSVPGALRPVRLLLALAVMAGTGAAVLGLEQAHAAEPIPSAGLVDLFLPGRVIGDGTPVTLELVALADDGLPFETASRIKLSATAGKVGSAQALDDGRVAYAWTPPVVSEPAEVRLRAKGKDATGRGFDREWTVSVEPAHPTRVELTANPPALVLGKEAAATLSLRLDRGVGADLLLTATEGTITALTPTGPGTWSARFEPKAVNYPHLALVTATDRRTGSVVGHVTIPLTGRTDYPVTTTPGASVLLTVGDREFGPYAADAKGQAVVPIEVGPGVTSGTLKSVVEGVPTESSVELGVPATRRIAIFPLLASVPADGTTRVPVRALVRTADGQADASAEVVFSSPAGGFGPAMHEGDGVYVAWFTPNVLSAGGNATIQVAIGADPGIQAASADLSLTAPPASLAVSAAPAALEPGATQVSLTLAVTGPGGAPLAGRPLVLQLHGGDLEGKLKAATEGTSTGTVKLAADASLVGVAAVAGGLSANPTTRVAVLPGLARVAPDGTSRVPVTFYALDALGQPVADVELTVTASGGTIPEKVSTGPNGVAHAFYQAGTTTQVARVQASAGVVTGAAGLLQIPADVAGPAAPLWSGTDADRAAVAAWRGSTAVIQVPRSGSAVAVAAASGATMAPVVAQAVKTAAAGEAALTATATVATIEILAPAATVAPGASTTLTIKALDAAGAPVAGAALEVLVSGGDAKPLEAKKDGTFTMVVTAPKGGEGTEVKVVLSTADGNIPKILKLPVRKAGDAAVWGPTTATSQPTAVSSEPVAGAATAPEPDAATIIDATAPEPDAATTDAATTDPGVDASQPKEERVPKERPESDLPWFRLRVLGVGGLYTYTQTPDNGVADNPLPDSPVTMGDSQAGSFGADADLAFWVTRGRWLGFEAEYRTARYSVEWPGTNTVIHDWVPNATGAIMARYPFEVDNARFYAALKVGGIYGDFITYTSGSEEGVVDFTPLPIASVGAGVEAGLDLSEVFYLKAALFEGFRTGLVPYANNVDVELGTAVGNFLITGGWAFTTRTIPVETATGTQVGVLEDRQNLFMLGVGVQL